MLQNILLSCFTVKNKKELIKAQKVVVKIDCLSYNFNMDLIKDKISRLPTSAGVYIMKDKDENVIYVGKAKNLKKRVSQYFLRKQEHIKVRNMVSNVKDFDFFVVNNEMEALALENNLIKKHQPYYNVLLKCSEI